VAKSRQQRRERREQQAAADDRSTGRALPQREPRPAAEPARVEVPRGGFMRESVAELKKVEWPNRPQVLAGTVVVIIAVAIVGAYLWAVDQAFKNLVEKVLL
jgi:preprotein translocase subunit SecE